MHPDVSTSYNNIAVVWHNKGEYDKALEFYNKSLNIRLKNLGEEHPSVATSYNNIGRVWNNKGEYVKALEFYQKSLNIRLKTLGEEHPDVANTYNNLGQVWNKKGEYNKALEFYQKCLQIELKTLGEEHSDVATSYFTIGTVLKNKTDYQQAIETFKKGYKIRRSGSFPFQIAQCYEAYGNKKEALNFYIESAEIRKSDSTEGIKAKSTTEAIVNAIRLAKEVNKEDELPDWMKNEKQ